MLRDIACFTHPHASITGWDGEAAHIAVRHHALRITPLLAYAGAVLQKQMHISVDYHLLVAGVQADDDRVLRVSTGKDIYPTL